MSYGLIFFLVLFSSARPSNTVTCPVCLDTYSEVKIHMLSSFLVLLEAEQGRGGAVQLSWLYVGCWQLTWNINLTLKLKAASHTKSLLDGVCRRRNTCWDGTERSSCFFIIMAIDSLLILQVLISSCQWTRKLAPNHHCGLFSSRLCKVDNRLFQS